MEGDPSAQDWKPEKNDERGKKGCHGGDEYRKQEIPPHPHCHYIRSHRTRHHPYKDRPEFEGRGGKEVGNDEPKKGHEGVLKEEPHPDRSPFFFQSFQVLWLDEDPHKEHGDREGRVEKGGQRKPEIGVKPGVEKEEEKDQKEGEFPHGSSCLAQARSRRELGGRLDDPEGSLCLSRKDHSLAHPSHHLPGGEVCNNKD